MRIMLRDTRIAFPSIFKASAPRGGGEVAFSASFLMPPAHPQLKELDKAFAEIATAKWGLKGAAILKALKSADKLCLHDGNSKSEYEGFEGNMFISSRSKTRPGVFDQQRQELTEQDGKPYAGCYVNASIDIWAQDNGFGKRINAQLRGVQFLRDGDAFAGGGKPAESGEFDEIGVDDTAASDDDLTN